MPLATDLGIQYRFETMIKIIVQDIDETLRNPIC